MGQILALSTGHSFYHLWVKSPEMQFEVDRLLAENEYHVVQSEFSIMGFFHLKTSAVKVLDVHDVEHDKIRRMWLNTRSPIRRFHYQREYMKFLREEMQVCNRQDALLVTSARDKEILNAEVPQVPKFVVPNGVDMTYFHPSHLVPEPASLVFTGLMSYVPNHDGMLYFLDKIFPLVLREVPHARVYIVGGQPRRKLVKRASHNVVVTGYVEDVRPYVWRSSVFVVPLRMGGGTRLKIFEAMAMKKPVVTTSIGCEGIDVRNEESALIADEPQAFAQAIVQLIQSADLRQRLVENGYELVKSEYEWSVIGQRVGEVYQSLLPPVKRCTEGEVCRTASLL